MAGKQQNESGGSGWGRRRDGASALPHLGFYLCPVCVGVGVGWGVELMIHVRATWALQHVLADLTLKVLVRDPRHVVTYNIFQIRV